MKRAVLGGILFVGLISVFLAAQWRGVNQPDVFGRTEIQPQMHALVVTEISPDGSIREIGRLVYQHETMQIGEPLVIGNRAEMQMRAREILGSFDDQPL